MKPIALVDDDQEIRTLLSEYLTKQGFTIAVFADGESFLKETVDAFSLVILDIGLPGVDGLTICRTIRQESAIPVIMLTAASDDLDRILGLELGADDYMGKPFNPRELVARIKAMMRRVDTIQSTLSVSQSSQHLVINTSQRHATINDTAIGLTGAEFDLLVVLAERQGKVVSKDDISRTLHGRSTNPFERSIDATVSRLRSKLSQHTDESIQNVRGKGYVLVIPCQF